MTGPVDRRRVLQLAIAAAVTPALVASGAQGATPGDLAGQLPGRLIAPPPVPMRYTRSVARELVDGAFFSVTREFRVYFTGFAGGFMLHGQQTGASVDAPAKLAEFAALEEGRDESGMFPIALDPFGQIVSAAIANSPENALRQAVAMALDRLSAQPIGTDERAEFSRFFSAMQQAGQNVTAYLPTDLFAPVTRSRRDAQDIAFPDGLLGTVETVFECDWDSGTGLMQQARRDVLTHVDSTRRATFESWSLTAI
ncbi:hypothetical protein [Aurantiacibacter rhizosphaerae]|uniref:Uncharacterized protein n=1 Tax=Aurantiacibacter rhizosphaerae TaxID=2691582 RepID=A0A844XA24_9SPHN|nr:hypothetical protein [Aurantiacibacter rhizosphaerae]MWV26385.1 hypothetical protein [Aurantiacibacter rhizosphaerae]